MGEDRPNTTAKTLGMCSHEALYARRSEAEWRTSSGEQKKEIPKITRREVEQQLKSMINGKAPDAAGIVAEMLKTGGERLQEALADIFNDVLLEGAKPPAEWKHTSIKVLFKKGGPQLPGNYQPIAILPIIYKVFSRVTSTLKEFLRASQSNALTKQDSGKDSIAKTTC